MAFIMRIDRTYIGITAAITDDDTRWPARA
jgi:hypothetical protein